MSTLIKCCSCIIVGSGICTVPFLNLSSGWSNSNFDLIFSADSTSPNGEKKELWKCSSISESNEVPFQGISQHIAFDCNNRGSGREGQLGSKVGLEWMIWVPLTALTDPWDLRSAGKQIDITTKTKKVVKEAGGIDGNQTTFESASFNNRKIVGTWWEDIESWREVGGEQIYKFKTTESGLEGDFIYLKVKQ